MLHCFGIRKKSRPSEKGGRPSHDEPVSKSIISGFEAGSAKPSGVLRDAQLCSDREAEDVQHSSMHGDALLEPLHEDLVADDEQPSSTLGCAQRIAPSRAASQREEPQADLALLDPCSRLDHVVSEVLASASVQHQVQHTTCTSSRQGAEPQPSPHSVSLPVQNDCHTVTLASLEQAACSQAPSTPLALLVLGHQLEAWERWQLRGSGRFERSSMTKELCDADMADDDAGIQSGKSGVLDDGTGQGCSAGSNVYNIPEEFPSPTHQANKNEMGTCLWLNDVFSNRLKAPSTQAALTTINQSISSNLTIQRHIAGFCRNVAVGRNDPVCFWSVLNPMLSVAQVEKICMWPCRLVDREGDGNSQQSADCNAVLISVAEGVSRDVQHEVLLHQHVAYQLAPCMVTVLSTQGCILTQNAESVAWLGCHSKEHSLRTSLTTGGMVLPRMLHQLKGRPTKEDPHGSPVPKEEILTKIDPQGEISTGEEMVQQSKDNPCGPVQAFCYLKQLFYDQEDLMMEMQKVLGDQEPFVERMEIKSPLLRAWMGAGEDEEVWHRVHIIRIVDPITCQPQYCLSQTDVTDIVYAERQVLQLQEQQSALLKEVLPQQVVEHLLMHRSDMLKCVPSQGYSPKANLAPASSSAQTSDRMPLSRSSTRASAASVPILAHTSHGKPPTASSSRGCIFNANPAPGSFLRHPSLHKPPAPSLSRGSLLNANPHPAAPLGHPSYRKPPASTASRSSLLSHTSRPLTFEAQQGAPSSEAQPKLSETARRINRFSSARQRVRTLKNLAEDDDPSSQPLSVVTKALRSKSFNDIRNSPSHPSTNQDGRSLERRPTSLDLLQLSLANSAGQQRLGPDGTSSPDKKHTISPRRSCSVASIFSPRASVSELPNQRTPPVQDTTPGLIWLTQQDVMDLATFHDNVTILFADIKGFTSMVNQLHPSQVMLFLNSLYSVWDSLLETFDVYKVETIGDCYMCCTGLFGYDEATGAKHLGGHDPQHARTMLEFAKAMIWSSQAIKTPLGDTVQVRVGIHSGSCSSGVVGQRMPRWCLFGDTVNTANRMESNGIPGCVHASEATVKMLEGEPWKSTGGIMAKGKGLMQTSLLPVLPGATHAAAASIAERHSTNSKIMATGESSSGHLLCSMSGEASMHGGQLQLQHSTTGLLSSTSGASNCPEESHGSGQTCEVPPLPLHSPFEAFLGGQQNPPALHAGPSALGTDSSRAPAAAEAGAATVAGGAAATAAAGWPHRHCLSCPGHAPGNTKGSHQLQHKQQACNTQHQRAHSAVVTGNAPDHWKYTPSDDTGIAVGSAGTAADCKGGGDEHQYSTSKTNISTAQGAGVPALKTHGRNPSDHGGLPFNGQRIAPPLSEQPTPDCGDVPAKPFDVRTLQTSAEHSSAARQADRGMSQSSSVPSAPWSISHQCKSSDVSGAGRDTSQRVWSHFEQERTSALQERTSQQERSSPLQGAWSMFLNVEHAARVAGAGVEGEPCHSSESYEGESGITLYPGNKSPTQRGDSVDFTPIGSPTCAAGTSLTLNPGCRPGGGGWVGEWESSGLWGRDNREGGSWQRNVPYEGTGNGGPEAAPGVVDVTAERHEATGANQPGVGPCIEQQQQHLLHVHKHADSSPHRQRSPMCPAGADTGNGGSGGTSAEDAADLNVHLLSSLYAPAILPPPQDQQQQQQQHHGGSQRVQQHFLAPLPRQYGHSTTADFRMNHAPRSPSSLSSQGSGGLSPSMGSGTTLVRTVSDVCSGSNLGRSHSRPDRGSAKHKTSPEVGKGEGLAWVMDGCQKLVDSVTSRVLQQLQESRPEPQARHAHPSETRLRSMGPWASRRSLDFSNDMRSSPSSSGRLGGAKWTRGVADHRIRPASLDVPRPAPIPAFPRQVSQPSPHAQGQIRQGIWPMQRSPPATVKQPLPSNACPGATC